MKLPVIQGVIRRRILVNFRVDPEVMQRSLPDRFAPKLAGGHAVAGICLIRLEEIRPLVFPAVAGLASENAAHRVAVTWTIPAGDSREGVFIPRRDTNSPLVLMAGGRLFPGEHHRAHFTVEDDGRSIDFSMESEDGETKVRLKAEPGAELPSSSVFSSIAEASSFFEHGSVGYSATKSGDRLEGLQLETNAWRVEPLQVADVYSSYFGDLTRFPRGSAVFDCALVMRDIPHRWRTVPEMYGLATESTAPR